MADFVLHTDCPSQSGWKPFVCCVVVRPQMGASSRTLRVHHGQHAVTSATVAAATLTAALPPPRASVQVVTTQRAWTKKSQKMKRLPSTSWSQRARSCAFGISGHVRNNSMHGNMHPLRWPVYEQSKHHDLEDTKSRLAHGHPVCFVRNAMCEPLGYTPAKKHVCVGRPW